MTKKLETMKGVEKVQKEMMIQEDPHISTDTSYIKRFKSQTSSECPDSDDDEGGLGLLPCHSSFEDDAQSPSIDIKDYHDPFSDPKLHLDRASSMTIESSFSVLTTGSPVDDMTISKAKSARLVTSEDRMTWANVDRLNSEGEEANISALSHHEAMDESMLHDLQSVLTEDFSKLTLQQKHTSNRPGEVQDYTRTVWEPDWKDHSSNAPLLYTKSVLDGATSKDSNKISEHADNDTITFKLSEHGLNRLAEASCHDDQGFVFEPKHLSDDCAIGKYANITPDMTSQQNGDGDTVLHIAIINYATDMVYFILNAVPSYIILDILNHLMQTPLHLAVLTHQHKVVRWLVSRGARIDTRDRNGDTALHLACKSGCLDCAKALTIPVQHSEIGKCLYRLPFQCIPQDPWILNYEGQACLHLATNSGNLDLLKYLLSPSVGHDVNIRNARTGRAILHESVIRRLHGVLMLLVQHRVAIKLDLDIKTFDGLTPLALASETKQSDIQFLLSVLGAKHDGIG